MINLLQEIMEAPNLDSLEKFLGMIPMILSPHGFFGQADVLGMPDTGGQVVYILDQVRALKEELLRRLARQRLADIPPQIIVVTRLIPNSKGTTCSQRYEPINGTKNSAIIRVPFRTEKGVLQNWVSRFDVWPYLDTIAQDVKKTLLEVLGGRPDLIIGNYSNGNIVASNLAHQLGVTQCTIAHALEKTKYPSLDVDWIKFEQKYRFSSQFTAVLIAMNHTDFIITSSYQEIAGRFTCLAMKLLANMRVILNSQCQTCTVLRIELIYSIRVMDGVAMHLLATDFTMESMDLDLNSKLLIGYCTQAGSLKSAITKQKSSSPSNSGLNANAKELLNLVSDARVGGMLSGKAGIVHFHVGSASSCLDPFCLNDSKGAFPITQMLSTHVSSRGPYLLQKAEVWLQAGSYVDLTADPDGENSTHNALLDWAKREMPLDNISISSDGFDSLPVFDSEGKLIKYGVASTKANLVTMTRLIHEGGWALEDALKSGTKNRAKFLSLSKKGCLEVRA